MRRLIALAGLALAVSAAAPTAARAQSEAQGIVDRATLGLQEMLLTGDPGARRDLEYNLGRARAVMICPRVLRAGFILGGQGGDCVLSARDGAGSWSSPAFYTMGSGSVGLQIGVQDMSVVMLIMTGRGLNAVMDSQFKVGGDAAVAFATLGGGIGGATTAAAGADILSFARARGLYAGISLDGSLLSFRNDFSSGYYGRTVSARQVVVEMAVHNPASDPLRAALMAGAARTANAMAPAVPPPAGPSPGPGYASGPGAGPSPGGIGGAFAAPGGVTRETLR